MEKMNVRNANLAGSTFDDSNMAGTSFTNINLSGSRFHDINFSNTQITAAQIGGCVFKHIGLPPDRSGKQQRQRPVTFEEATLCDSVFRDVDLSNVQIIGCNIEGMTIDGIRVSDLLDTYRRATKI